MNEQLLVHILETSYSITTKSEGGVGGRLMDQDMVCVWGGGYIVKTPLATLLCMCVWEGLLDPLSLFT